MYRPILLSAATCVALGASSVVKAQSYEAGIHAGTFIYQGDLTPSALGSYRTARFGVGLWGSKHLTNNLSLRANLALASFKGSDAAYSKPDWRQQRNLYFTSSLKELSLLGVWDVSGGRSSLTSYVFTGVSFAFVKVKRDYSGFNTTYFANDKAATDGLATDISRTPPRVLPVVPLGAGLRYAVSSSLSLNAETSYRLTQTDYLDGFSQVANPDRKDHYQSFTVGVIYSFGKKGKYSCPTVKQ